ncbi:MAG: hypothetical protein IJZ74_01480 [Clostridia bacterium]|nr:hypothetical protein [Clostridia bacterium]
MPDMNGQNDQYRRPRPHFSDEKTEVRATIDRRQLLAGCAMLLGLTLLMIVGLTPRSRTAIPDAAPEAAQVQSDSASTLSADCQVIQHLTFTPCGHDMTRRQSLPVELAGKTRQELTAAYDAWQVTSFASAEVVMVQSLDMYCPEHMVLMPDEGGSLCIFQNRYGDALALVKELAIPLNELPDDVQNEVRQGKGFDSLDALEKWLESAES